MNFETSDQLSRMLREVVMTSPGKSWPTYDGYTLKRHEWLTASEATNCIRRLAFQKQAEANATPRHNMWAEMSDEEYENRLAAMGPDGSDGYFVRGDNVELWVVEQLRKGLLPHERLLLAGDDQVSFHIGKHRLSGTPDGLLVNTEEHTMRLLEFKSAQAAVSQPRYAHNTQVGTNMFIINECIAKHGDTEFAKMMGWEELLDDNNRLPDLEGGLVLYINPSHYLTLQEFLVYPNQMNMQLVIDKAKNLFIGDSRFVHPPSQLPAEGIIRGTCFGCAFVAACRHIEETDKNEETALALQHLQGRAPQPAMPKFGPAATAEEVVEAATSYQFHKNVEKDAKEQQERYRPLLIEWMKTQEDSKKEFIHDNEKVSIGLSISERSKGLDNEALGEALKELDKTVEDFRKPGTTVVETLRVSVDFIEEEAA